METNTEQTGREEPRATNDNRANRPLKPAKASVATRAASFGEKWREARPSKKVVAGLMVVAAILTMIIGFNWGGWVAGGTAQRRIDAGAQDAVALRLAPICVAQFNLDPEKTTKLAELKAISSTYGRSNYVKKQVWAIMPGEQTPDNGVADACARLLMDS
jgi:hypothetical protein